MQPNYAAREINLKIVYYGPGLGGKTTNLEYIHKKTKPDCKGKMISLATQKDRTIFFDLLPIEVGEIKGFKTKIQLFTVPGQRCYNESRQFVLKGVDGLVFVVDSQKERLAENIESFENMKININENRLNLTEIPYVIQLNKRDLPNILPSNVILAQLKCENIPWFEAVAKDGVGVFETFKSIAKMVLTKFT
ncbi:MAG: ADP-ribosylation factor-like protein [bacterium]